MSDLTPHRDQMNPMPSESPTDCLKRRIKEQTEFAKKRQCDCEEANERDSVEAWRGYVSALRWVRETIGFATGEYHYPGNWPFCSPPQFPVMVGLNSSETTPNV